MSWQLGLAWLAHDLGVDLQRAARRAGGGRELWQLGPVGWARHLPRIGQDEVRLLAARDGFDRDAMRRALADAGVEHVALRRPEYPPALAEIPDPPFGLFVHGQLDSLGGEGGAPLIAIVGSRRPTSAGVAFAHNLARQVAERGGIVVSGLAHGIDAAAHEGALSVNAATVAVVGCGVDVLYPRRHQALRDRIRGRGAVVSEYWLGTTPSPWRFPARNRIVAGLADAVVVVEAAERSGALITADFALEQGRPVLAVPGAPWAGMSAGCNALIRVGAALCESVDDLLADVPHDGWQVTDNPPAGEPITEPDRHVRNLLLNEPLSFDEICERVGVGAGEIGATLGRLEMAGHILRGEGQRYWAAPLRGVA